MELTLHRSARACPLTRRTASPAPSRPERNAVAVLRDRQGGSMPADPPLGTPRHVRRAGSVGRSAVHAMHGMIATSQPLAVQAAIDVLRRGGNAVDAAIAANAVLGVVEPMSCGIGGDLFAMVWEARTGKLFGLNASGRSPYRATLEEMRARGLSELPAAGPLSWSVPGAVDGWEALRARFGSRPLAELLEPAIAIAEEGFPVSEVIAGMWQASEPDLAAHPASARTYLPAGRAPPAGEIFRNPALAATYRELARGGRDAFYQGRIARELVAFSQASGGLLAPDDLAAVDGERNCVSLIQSIYQHFGSQMVAGKLGFALQNRGSQFSLDPAHPNRLEPHKRPFHTIIPAFVTRGGKPWLVFGVMGADMQPQGQAQVLVNLLDFGMNVPAGRE